VATHLFYLSGATINTSLGLPYLPHSPLSKWREKPGIGAKTWYHLNQARKEGKEKGDSRAAALLPWSAVYRCSPPPTAAQRRHSQTNSVETSLWIRLPTSFCPQAGTRAFLLTYRAPALLPAPLPGTSS